MMDVGLRNGFSIKLCLIKDLFLSRCVCVCVSVGAGGDA